MEPRTAPPASAPPVPPSETESLLGSSYQTNNYYEHNYGPLREELQGGGSYKGPTITNYTISAAGDINLRPNTGEANWFEGEILGLALTEILKGLQWSNILSCALVIVLEVMVAIFRIFTPARFILGCYLAFFASLVLRVEIAHILKQNKHKIQSVQEQIDTINSLSGIRSHSKVPDVQAPVLRDNFGMLFHPSGKATMLLLMGSMCLGQHNNLLEVLLGLVFSSNAILQFYLLCRYPDYRRTEDIPIPKLPPLQDNLPGPAAFRNTWSYYENDASSLWKVTSTIAEGSAVLTGSYKN